MTHRLPPPEEMQDCRRRPRPLVIAHRGGAPGDIENSRTAFEHGLQVGSDVIECDIRTSLDGVVVLFHDARARGTPVMALTLDDLRRHAPTLLTFPEFVAWAETHPAAPRMVLDFKERDIDTRIWDELRNDAFRARVLVTTQHVAAIRRLTSAFPDIRVGLSRGHAAAGANPAALRPWIVRFVRPLLFHWLLPQLRWSRANTVVIHHRLASLRNVRRFHRAGLRVYVWTVDDCLEAQQLAGLGVDYIATNVPWLMRACLGLFSDDYSTPRG